jgi:hypothetical protein
MHERRSDDGAHHSPEPYRHPETYLDVAGEAE